MTDRKTRRLLVDLSVFTACAIVLAASYRVVARVDERREALRQEVTTVATPSPAPSARPAPEPTPSEPATPSAAPTNRMKPVRRVVRRRIIVRRTRAS